jgi:hypothetical protein
MKDYKDGPSKYSSGASISAYARPLQSNPVSILGRSPDDQEEEVQDSYSDIDESMERYQKRKGLPVRSDKSKSGGSGSIANECPPRRKAEAIPRIAAPGFEDKHINISQLLEKN